MKVLIACERFGIVRDAFLKLNHDAVSCDLVPSVSPGPHYHGDVRDILKEKWHLLIAHPPCTDLAVSGARYFEAKRLDGRQQASINFFMSFINETKHIPMIAIENPVGIMSSKYRKPDQIIQPYEYGHPESKKTCLWLKNLPTLQSTNKLSLPECGHWNNQTASGQNKIGPSAERAMIRSKTYQGIADAMAEQWGNLTPKCFVSEKSAVTSRPGVIQTHFGASGAGAWTFTSLSYTLVNHNKILSNNRIKNLL